MGSTHNHLLFSFNYWWILSWKRVLSWTKLDSSPNNLYYTNMALVPSNLKCTKKIVIWSNGIDVYHEEPYVVNGQTRFIIEKSFFEGEY
jgi:hypothetical protein